GLCRWSLSCCRCCRRRPPMRARRQAWRSRPGEIGHGEVSYRLSSSSCRGNRERRAHRLGSGGRSLPVRRRYGEWARAEASQSAKPSDSKVSRLGGDLQAPWGGQALKAREGKLHGERE